MAQTEYLEMELTGANSDKTFLNWRLELAGLGAASALNKIDAAVKAVNQDITEITERADEQDTEINSIKAAVGSPLVATTVAGMTDTSKVYVYTGSETGYTAGDWYYYDESQTPPWVSGGVYNSVAVNTDKNLELSDVPADGKAVGDALNTKQDSLTFDIIPVQNSNNPVKSGGVFSADQKNAELALNAYMKNYADGNVASFDDGADNIDCEKMASEITCSQSFGNYDHPWPGYGGKNLLDYTAAVASAATLTLKNSDHGIRLAVDESANTHSASIVDIPVRGGVAYTLSADILVHSGTAFMGIYQDSSSSAEVTSVSYSGTDHEFDGVTVTFNCPEDGIVRVTFSVTDSYSDFKNIQLEAGVEATEWEPYTNICPISGHNSVSIYHCGKNIVDYRNVARRDTHSAVEILPEENGFRVYSVDSGQYRAADISGLVLKDGVTYVLSADVTVNSSDSVPYFGFREIRTANFKNSGVNIYESGHYSVRHTFSADTPVLLSFLCTGKDGGNGDIIYSNVQLEVGENDTSFEPYNGDVYNISLGSAGTVYGGTLDAATGKLVLTHFCGTLDGSEGFYLMTNGGYRRFIFKVVNAGWPLPSSDKSERDKTLCSHFALVSNLSANAWGAYRLSSDSYFVLLDEYGVFATSTDLNNWLGTQNTSGSPVQLVYKIDEPQVYQLTPTEVKTLLNYNTIWSYAGDVSVAYRSMPGGTNFYDFDTGERNMLRIGVKGGHPIMQIIVN